MVYRPAYGYIPAAYGVLSVQENGVAETTTDVTPRKIAAFDTEGLSKGMTVDAVTGKDITAQTSGIYQVHVQVSFSGSPTKTVHCELYVDGVATGFECHRKIGSGADIGSASLTGIVALEVGQTVSVYQWSDDGGSVFTLDDGQLTAHRIAG